MFTKKIAIAACISALSATVLAGNAHAMSCEEMTGNQLLAAIERGQCVVGANSIVEDNRTGRNGGSQGGSSSKSGGGYHY